MAKHTGKAQRETVEGGRRRGVPRAAVLRIPAVHQPARQPFRGGEQRYRRTRGTAREKVNSLRSEIDALSTRVNDLSKTLDSQNADGSQDSESAGNGTMLPRRGRPGTGGDARRFAAKWENMVDANGSSANINDYVVHQQDIEAVVNALWAGGAESMQIMDQRVLFNSAVRAAPATCCCCKAEVFAAVQKSRRSDQWRA